ncbi:MAG: DUF3419 family protein, partial [Saprospiraceae bacterium]
MKQELTERVDFDLIRYANCWEDPYILLEGLSPVEGSKILSIGSAGDNSFSLLSTAPAMVIAVDINPIQLYLIELKKAAIKHLSREEVIEFLGFKASENRIKLWIAIKEDLSSEALNYWERNFDLIHNGIIYQGKFERYFQSFGRYILPFIHSRKTIQQLFEVKSSEAQELFYKKKWNTWRWRFLFKIFFSKYVMGKFGRDPEFLNEVKVNVGSHIFLKAEHELSSIQAQSNFILHFNLCGNFGDLLPHYLGHDFDLIKDNIDCLRIEQCFAQEAIAKYGKFNYMNLSNIFEYMDAATFQMTGSSLVDGTVTGGKLAYWNLMVPRRISEYLPEKVSYQQAISEALTAKDKGFF